jgi:hypothetical protein
MNQSVGPIRRFVVVATACLALTACSGDSSPKQKCFPAKGKLTIKSQPAAGAIITLSPQGGGNPEVWVAGYPRAVVQADGSFELETYGEKDGAPAGDYLALVLWPEANAGDDETPTVDRLGGRYSEPATSKLAVKIDAAPTEIPPINIP